MFHEFFITQDPVPPFACQFSPGTVCKVGRSFIHSFLIPLAASFSYVLAVADEEGSLRLLDTRKSATQSLVKGTLFKIGHSR